MLSLQGTEQNISSGSALEVTTFKELCDQVVQEHFKDCTPPEVATHIVEQGIQTASKAATLVDELEITILCSIYIHPHCIHTD